MHFSVSIALIIPTMKTGGAERVLSQLANHWATQGNEIHLFLLAKADRFYTLDSKVIVHELGFENIGGKGKKFLSEIKTFLQLRKTLKSIKPDSVLSFMTKYNTFTIMASFGLGLHVFVSDRSNPYKKIPFLDSQLRKLLYPFARGIIAQTDEAKKVLERKTGHKNICVIPNPVRDVKLFSDIKREKIVINVGRMVPEKGQEYLLEAFSKVQNKDWRLVILGDGPLREYLGKRAKELNISEQLLLPGVVDNVDEWFAKSTIFVFSSVSEGFPNALLEAMSAGLPCISFNCPVGPSDIIEDGINGFLVPVKDIQCLYEKMELLIKNPNLREKIIKNINTDKYCIKKISDQFIKTIIV